jgi:hypothetical protein
MRIRFTRLSLTSGLVLGVMVSTVAAQESKSAPLAKELSQLLTQAKSDSVAARDPAAADRFVAALFLPGQLLVVSAQYASPPLLNERLGQGGYKDVYMDLQSASVPASKRFIDDFGADGLRARPEEDQPFDSMESGATRRAFDGNWRRQKISEEEYMKSFSEADENYAAMLTILLGQLKKNPS